MEHGSSQSYSDNRQFLHPTDRIALYRRGSTHPTEFTIHGLVGSGGTAICYLAEANGQRGRLKEFYPCEIPQRNIYYFLQRDGQNQLLPMGDSMAQRFQAMCQDFIQAYDTLEQAKRQQADFELLNNFIPPCEILLGRSENGNPGSVYVWTVSDKFGIDFDTYLQTVRSQPQKQPAQKLFQILSVLSTLTDCIRVIHSANLLHLDIKPGNFLVPYDGNRNINTGSISLFDVNSLYAPHSGIPKFAGTEGFRAPELLRGNASLWSDIYSIGAMLFYGIIIDPQLPSPYYRDEWYPQLEHMLERSQLILSCASASSPSVHYLLLQILQKCLAHKPSQRYESCDQLLEDLNMAKTYLLPDVYSSRLGQNKRLAILDVASEAVCDPTAILQDLLYRAPLYTVDLQPGQPLRVLVVGAGTYGQTFLDLCLQTAQMREHPLHLLAVSRDRELNQAVYLHYRPALTEFVDVNGAGCGGETPYAKLDFESLSPGFLPGDVRTNRVQAGQLLAQRPHTIFISLGDDQLNAEVAQAFAHHAPGCPIHFVVQDGNSPAGQQPGAVWVNRAPDKQGVSKALDNMAFSTHLAWCDGGALDMAAERKRFRQSHNYHSSLAFVLSIPYKLKGIIPISQDPVQLAEDFRNTVLHREGEVFHSLVALEHRRWVLEKVTQGWTAPRTPDGQIDLLRCIRRGRVSDPANKTHPCILRSTPDTPLLAPDFDWEEPPYGLDPLDTLSVELHQAFCQAAEEFQRTQPLEQEDILWLRHLCDGHEILHPAFRRYLLCLQRILEGSKRYAQLHDSFADDLLSALRSILPDMADPAKQRLKQIRKAFFPAMESCHRHNYKQTDEILVRSIPYILTNRHQPYLAMAFQEGDNDAIFSNVASASVLHPAKLTYLYVWQKDSHVREFVGKLSAVLEYLKKRHIRSHVSLLIALPADLADPSQQLNALLTPLKQHTALSDFTLLPCARLQDAPARLLQILAKRRTDLFDGSTQLFRSQVLNNQVYHQLLQHKIPYFEFDRDSQTFPVHERCQHLAYLQGSASLRIEDMFGLMNARDKRYRIPEFADDYQALWEIYTGAAQPGPYAFRNAVTNWTQLCTQLDAYFQKQDLVGTVILDPAQKGIDRPMVFHIPSFGYRAAKKLVEALVKEEVLTGNSTVYTHTSDSCRLELYTPWNIFGIFERFFGNPYRLADPNALQVESFYQGNTRHVRILCSKLQVKNLILEDRFSHTVLEQLHQKRLITNFFRREDNAQCVSFTIPSARMKKLLTCAGEIMEVYCYYEILRTGYFDDLASGYEFQGPDGVVSEIDCVMTKGFRSILVECKARKQLDQNFYHKLQSISQQFGIGMQRVLIANAYAGNNQTEEVNQIQISRGNQMGIITIHKPEEIIHIGQTMKQIMDGTYQEE